MTALFLLMFKLDLHSPNPRRMRSSAAPVRCHLSEAGEKLALQILKDHLRRQKHVTSDDVRLAVRTVASQGGAVPLPPDFPPSRWVLEFKRVHGFVQLSSFAFSNLSNDKSISRDSKTTAAFEQPERLPLRSAVATESHRPSITANTRINPIAVDGVSARTFYATMAKVMDSSSGNISSDEDIVDSGSLKSTRMVMHSATSPDLCVPFDTMMRRQVQLRQSYGQRHQHHLQQQQRRAMLVENRRRATAWTIPSCIANKSMQCDENSGRENEAMTGLRNGLNGSSNVGSSLGLNTSVMTPHTRNTENNNVGIEDGLQDIAPSASLSNDNRGYKLSHTVPIGTWQKAIDAVEQQGMSLRAAAKLFGVHFAALHRRVKKRAQSSKDKGINGYFHPNDEAGIMRVVVARAELGILMTFAELMRLVETAALRKLPDLSIEEARNLLTRFQSRNAESIRHIIDDWPLLQSASSLAGDREIQPYTRHPGFDFGTARSGPNESTSISNMLITKSVCLYNRNDSRLSEMRLIDTMGAMDLGTTTAIPFLNRSECAMYREIKRPRQGCRVE